MLKKLDKFVALILKIITMGCCIGISIILLIRVIVRFTPFTLEMSWTDEVITWLMAYMIFCGATLIFRMCQHFTVDLLPQKLKGNKAGAFLDTVITVISILFMAVLFYYGCQMVASTTQFSPMLKVPYKFQYSSIPINCAIIICYLIRDFVGDIGEFRGKKRYIADDLLPDAEKQ